MKKKSKLLSFPLTLRITIFPKIEGAGGEGEGEGEGERGGKDGKFREREVKVQSSLLTGSFAC